MILSARNATKPVPSVATNQPPPGHLTQATLKHGLLTTATSAPINLNTGTKELVITVVLITLMLWKISVLSILKKRCMIVFTRVRLLPFRNSMVVLT